jgi:alkanesulfonate monooxygenase SsuD/methylene tetrahydromethanopterin reductase-like flavin-dependent oxidoreductase (luciferase family)
MEFGICFCYQRDLAAFKDVVQEWAKCNFDAYFTDDDAMPYGNVWILADLLAQNCPERTIGTSVVNLSLRHPVDTAIAALSIHQAYHVPIILGVGAGAPRRWGAIGASPITLQQTREAVEIIRELLTTGHVDFTGRFYSATTELVEDLIPLEKIPIFLAGRGPKTIELAGEIADGIFAPWFPGAYADFLCEHLEIGNSRGGRGKTPVIAWTPAFPGEELLQAAQEEANGRYAKTPEPVLAYLKTWEPDPEKLIPQLVVSGSISECVEQLASFRKIGAMIAFSVAPACQNDPQFKENLLRIRAML